MSSSTSTSTSEKPPQWNVFEGVKTIRSITPEALMGEINSAITALEYARSAVFLQQQSSINSKPKNLNTTIRKKSQSEYDVRVADQAYKAGRASMAAGNMDEAALSLNIALSNCPPNKISAVAKLHSLISVTSHHNSSNTSKIPLN